MAANRKQACVFKHPKDEDVRDSGHRSNGIWSPPKSFQSCVSGTKSLTPVSIIII